MLVIAVDRCKRDTGKAQPANKAFRERGFSDAASALCASNESAGDWWSVCFMFCFGCHEFFCCFFHFVRAPSDRQALPWIADQLFLFWRQHPSLGALGAVARVQPIPRGACRGALPV